MINYLFYSDFESQLSQFSTWHRLPMIQEERTQTVRVNIWYATKPKQNFSPPHRDPQKERESMSSSSKKQVINWNLSTIYITSRVPENRSWHRTCLLPILQYKKEERKMLELICDIWHNQRRNSHLPTETCRKNIRPVFFDRIFDSVPWHPSSTCSGIDQGALHTKKHTKASDYESPRYLEIAQRQWSSRSPDKVSSRFLITSKHSMSPPNSSMQEGRTQTVRLHLLKYDTIKIEFLTSTQRPAERERVWDY